VGYLTSFLLFRGLFSWDECVDLLSVLGHFSIVMGIPFKLGVYTEYWAFFYSYWAFLVIFWASNTVWVRFGGFSVSFYLSWAFAFAVFFSYNPEIVLTAVEVPFEDY
jgi:hypothetical protein